MESPPKCDVRLQPLINTLTTEVSQHVWYGLADAGLLPDEIYEQFPPLEHRPILPADQRISRATAHLLLSTLAEATTAVISEADLIDIEPNQGLDILTLTESFTTALGDVRIDSGPLTQLPEALGHINPATVGYFQFEFTGDKPVILAGFFPYDAAAAAESLPSSESSASLPLGYLDLAHIIIRGGQDISAEFAQASSHRPLLEQ